MTILYEIEDSLYINLTNKCPCACTFCIREEGEGVHGSDSLWLKHDPNLKEILDDFEKYNLESYKEVVFCGYGEPLIRLDTVIEVCKYIRSKSKVKIRVNTNGLADLIHKKATAELLEGYVDAISISLNAPNEEEYLAVTRSKFGSGSFAALLKFAADCKKHIKDVTFTVVDVIPPTQIEEARKLSEAMDITFRVRQQI